MKVTLECIICRELIDLEMEVPNGWDDYVKLEYYHYAFCPKHSKIKKFLEAQCPGCVSGWGDPSCPLWKNLTFYLNSISQEDINVIRKGKCPYRTNGTGLLDSKSIRQIDISDVAPLDISQFFAQELEILKTKVK